MSTPPSILVVEDDENLGLALTDNLEDEGYRVTLARTGADGLAHMNGECPSPLTILDLMLPDTDGYTVCRSARSAGYAGGILMLTARTLEEDLVRGFEAGADDYLTKPYRLRELLVRVSALMRRSGHVPASPVAVEGLRFAGFALDPEARTLRSPDGKELDLTRTEFDLLHYFVTNPDRALTRHELLEKVWGYVHVEARTVDNFVSSLKKKLDLRGRGGMRFRTIRGVGYRFEIEA